MMLLRSRAEVAMAGKPIRIRSAVFVLLSAALLAAPAWAQSGVGDVSFPNSGSKAAQSAFLHGLAQLHNFEYASAARDFRRAERIDPGFAMAYWGEAMTYNHPLWSQQNRAAARQALDRLAPTPTARLAKASTEREKEYLGAVEILYGSGTKEARDFAYSDAMARLHHDFPGDINAAAFYALSILGTAHQGRDERIYMRAAAILLPLFYAHPHHPGIAHYLIHSCDDPIHAGLALPAAEAYSKIAPNAAHAQHMTSHIFLALGMWDDVVRANINATGVVNRQRAAAKQPPSRCGHYNYWLEYGYLEQGRIAQAKQVLTGCRAEAGEAGMAARARGTVDPDNASVGSFAEMRARFLADTGDWKGDVAGWTVAMDGALMPRFNQAYATGFATAGRGDAAAARKSLATMKAILPRLPAAFDRAGLTVGDPERQLPAIQTQQLEAAILSAEGHADQAVAMARKAAEAGEDLPYAFGPPDPAKPSFELLGDLLLKTHHPREAKAAFEQALLRTPRRTQTLLGLYRAEKALGDTAAAHETETKLRQIWHNADSLPPSFP
jgi:Tfp pilus assembly protein PilF